MRKIRNTMLFLHALLLSALFLAGCVREEFPGSGSVAEGKPSQVAFNLIVPAMSSSPSTRALTPEQESKIENLRVMVFRADGSVVTNGKYTGTGNQFTVNSYSGSNYTLFFIANVSNAEIETELQSAASLSDVEKIVTTATQLDFGMNTTHPLMMTGKQANVNFLPGNSTYGAPVQLHFIAAKVTVKVIDNTPFDHGVSIIGWDVENAPARSYLFPQTADINQPGTTADKDDYWLTTDVDYSFETVDAPNRTVSQTLYVFENRRGGRVYRNLPGKENQYKGMSFYDKDHRGKGWFKPVRATAIVIKAMHKTPVETRQVKAHIYLGANNHSDYNIERGKHYTFTVTVNGLNDIKVDTNIDYTVRDLLVDYGDNLTMDTHPDFRPMRIHAPRGVVTMEILDESGNTYKDPGFSATWLKISPLDLMYHQVKQTGDAAKWQQDANPTSRIVRGRYIPHTSVRNTLTDAQKWWTAHPEIVVADNDDDEMAFKDATYRMCYKITDIEFTDAAAVTNQTLYVYADEYHQERGAMRKAFVRFTFLKDGNPSSKTQERTFIISQDGYFPVFNETNPDAGLTVLNEDGNLTNVKNKFVFETLSEPYMVLYPGMSPSLQKVPGMQWGHTYAGGLIYADNKDDKYRNGKFLTANAVYVDVKRGTNYEPTGFGDKVDSYRPMYGNTSGPIRPYNGQHSGVPYYYPDAHSAIYHPIYKSNAARYCHEKNRDVNGDGIIDESEAKWYLPAIDQLSIAWIEGLESHPFTPYQTIHSSTEDTAVGYVMGMYLLTGETFSAVEKKESPSGVICVRNL